MAHTGTLTDVSCEPWHTYVYIARGIIYGSCSCPNMEMEAIRFLLTAMKSGKVDPHLILLVFLNDESVLWRHADILLSGKASRVNIPGRCFSCQLRNALLRYDSI